MRVCSFQIKSISRLWIHQAALTCRVSATQMSVGRERFKVGKFPTRDCRNQGIVCTQVNFAYRVVAQALGIVADFVWVQVFITVTWMVRNGKFFLEQRCLATNLKCLIATLM